MWWQNSPLCFSIPRKAMAVNLICSAGPSVFLWQDSFMQKEVIGKGIPLFYFHSEEYSEILFLTSKTRF